MKIAVVTTSAAANVPPEPVIIADNIEYHAFVDGDLFSANIPGWTKHKIIDFTASFNFKSRRNAKIYKILPFLFLPNFDYYIYLDSGHILEKDPIDIINQFLQNSDIAVFKHPERNCVYEEGEEVKKISFDIPELIDRQLNFYRKANYPANNGLYELPARIQKNTEAVQRMSLMWWELICKYSSRDQISFPYACHTTNITPAILPGRANSFRGNNIMPQIIASNHKRTI